MTRRPFEWLLCSARTFGFEWMACLRHLLATRIADEMFLATDGSARPW